MMPGKWEILIVIGLGLALFGERLPIIGPLAYRLFRNTWFFREYRPWFERNRRRIGVVTIVVLLALVYWIRVNSRP